MSADRLVATYHLGSFISLDHAADVLAGEQSSGTFTKVALESDELTRDHRAHVIDIEPSATRFEALPGSIGADRGTKLHSGVVRIAFPVVNLGPSVAALLTTVAGNLFEIAELGVVKLVDVEVPDALQQRYPGPLHGIPGTRTAVGNADEVLVGTIIKPSVGLQLEQLESLVRDLAMAGIDFIKDDELNTNPPYAPLADRIRVVMGVIREVADRTGKKTMYAFNVTGDLDDMRRATDLIVEHEGTCAMAAIPWIGLPALAELRRHTDLVIHGHRGGYAALDRSPSVGVSYRVLQKLARLCGADHLHVGGIDSKFWEDNKSVVGNVEDLASNNLPGAPVLPAVSSAQSAATAATTHALLGSRDLLILAGGGIHGHPGGVADGVQSLREAWRAVAEGKDPADVAASGSPLDVALRTFGGLR